MKKTGSVSDSKVDSLDEWFKEYGGRSGQLSRTQTANNFDKQFAARLKKLDEQKELAKKMNASLSSLNDDSNLARKNLEAAIAVSKQPGYFEYHTPANDIADKAKSLPVLTKKLNRIANEIEQIDAELSRDKSGVVRTTLPDTSMSSLQQWFDNFGRPKHEDIDGLVTTFHTNAKVYGGTSHHRAFKSQASSMKKGRVTR